MGKSTAPWDQPRNASTVSVCAEDFDRAGINVRADGRYTKDEVIKALQSRQALYGLTAETKSFLDLQVESDGTPQKDHRGRTVIKGILISWANRRYAANFDGK